MANKHPRVDGVLAEPVIDRCPLVSRLLIISARAHGVDGRADRSTRSIRQDRHPERTPETIRPGRIARTRHTPSQGSCQSGLLEGLVHDLGCGRIEVGFDSLKGVPPADLHDDTGIHLAINEEALGEASPEIV